MKRATRPTSPCASMRVSPRAPGRSERSSRAADGCSSERGGTTTDIIGGMPGVVRIVDQRIAAVQGPIQVLFLAALVISFGVVIAAGCSRSPPERVDGRGAPARGWGPARVGFKGRLESSFRVRRRGLGFLVACGRSHGSARRSVEPVREGVGARRLASRRPRGDRVVGVVSGSVSCRITSRARCRASVLFFPWEVPVFSGAYVMSGRLRSSGGVLGAAIERPAPAVFMFPLLLAFGVAILTAQTPRLRPVPSAS